MKQEIKRLFFGVEVHAPWPSELPKGRLLDETHRHLTLAFLGNVPYLPLQQRLESFPPPSMQVGHTGYFDSCLLLPPRHPHVIAWHVQWWDAHPALVPFQETLKNWLLSHDYSLDQRPWLPHVTLCRQPFDAHAWEKTFMPLPCYTSSLHLYESVGGLHYEPIWSYPILAPFEEIDHTADMAFIIRGETLAQLYQNAFTALAFKAPAFIHFFDSTVNLETLDDVIIALNSILGRVDSAGGCPMKAISFHGEIEVLQQSLLQWEMIVDV